MRLFVLLGLLLFTCTGFVKADEAVEVDVVDDVESVEEEEEVVERFGDGLSEEERAQFTAGQETHEFQAEVSRLMDIIINSLYSKREVFMRELISNAADALDKIRFTGLTDKTELGEGDAAELDIKITLDKDAGTITLTDKGIGMSREDLVANLGIVAKSGTTEFLEAAAKGTDAMSLIGQFGVGFYSVYLVADKVTVVSKKNGHDQYIWESTANSVFTIGQDPRGDTLGRGTSIIIHLKEDAEEFLKQDTMEKLVARYSQFINFPIYLWTSRVESKEVPDEDAEIVVDADADEDVDEDGLEVTEEEDEDAEEAKPKMKTVKETIEEWKRLNEVKAIWTRNPKEVEDEDYQAFYDSLVAGSNDYKLKKGYMDKIHFMAEGEISFRSILYIPEEVPSGLYDNMNAKSNSVRLYVRRVLIADTFDEFMPRYMQFVQGVVDSDDLPLNVSRETLAQSRVLKTMSKKIVRKVLEMLRKMAEESERDLDDDDDDDAVDEAEPTEEKEDRYIKFWKQYGKSIKLGVMDDKKNKSKLAKLLRYQTSKSEGKYVSLERYVDGMQEDQKEIFYITGESLEKLSNSPFLEKLKKKGIEVLFMMDPLDEYLVQSMNEFDGITLQSITKKGLNIGDQDYLKKLETAFKPLTTWFKDVYGEALHGVVVSDRIEGSPCVVVTDQYGWSANMERIMKAQALGDTGNMQYMLPKKTLEINPRHPIIRELQTKVAEDPEDQKLKDLALLLVDSALLASGFSLDDTATFAKRIDRVVRTGLDVAVDAELFPEAELLPEEDEEEEEDAEEEEAPVEGKDEL